MKTFTLGYLNMCRRAEYASLHSLRWQARLCSSSQPLQLASNILKPGNSLTAAQICKPSHYYLQPDDITVQVNQAIGADNHVFVKGSVKAGKSSWGYLMSLAFPKSVWYIAGETSYDDEDVEDELQMPMVDFKKAANQHGNVVIFDEAHRLWQKKDSESKLYNFFVKNLEKRLCTVVFLSTTSYIPLMGVRSSPKEVTNTHVLRWAMDTKSSMEYVCGYRRKAALSEPSAAACQTLHRFFDGHRGLMACALKYICDKKYDCGTPQEMHQAIALMYRDDDASKSPFASRAVYLNGGGSHPLTSAIIDCVAGFGSATPAHIQRVLSMESDEVALGVANAVTIGAIVTAKGTAVQRADTVYEIPNPFLLANRELASPIHVPKPKTAFGVLRIALAFFDYREFVTDARKHPVRKDGLPHEDNFNAAMHSALKRAGFKPEMVHSTARGQGKPDLLLGGFCIESMVHSTKSQFVAHHCRFMEQELYETSKLDDALLVVFVPRDNLESAQSIATQLVKSHAKTPIALVEIGDSLWEWRVVLIRNSMAPKVVKIRATCAVPGQKYLPPVRSGLFVRVKIGKHSRTADIAPTLRINRFPSTVDGLIKAVSTEFQLNQRQLITVEVFPPNEKPGKEPFTRMSTPLEAASEKKPYHVQFA